MLLTNQETYFKKMSELESKLAPLVPYLKEDRKKIVTQLYEMLRKRYRIPAARMKTVLPVLTRIGAELYDFKKPMSERLELEITTLIGSGIDMVTLLHDALVSSLMRLFSVERYQEVNLLYASHLAGYYHLVITYLKTLSEELHAPPEANRALTYKEITEWLGTEKHVRLFNVYKGLPIRYEGKVVEFGRDKIILELSKEKGIAVDWEHYIIVYKKEDEPLSVLLDVEKVDFEGELARVIAKKPRWIENYVNRRKHVRVQLDQPIKAKISALGRQLEVDVIDISSQGVCLQTDVGYGLPVHEPIEVTLPLEKDGDMEQNLILRGRLKYVSTLLNGFRRYHIYLILTPKKERILATFVAQKEIELMSELKRKAEELLV